MSRLFKKIMIVSMIIPLLLMGWGGKHDVLAIESSTKTFDYICTVGTPFGEQELETKIKFMAQIPDTLDANEKFNIENNFVEVTFEDTSTLALAGFFEGRMTSYRLMVENAADGGNKEINLSPPISGYIPVPYTEIPIDGSALTIKLPSRINGKNSEDLWAGQSGEMTVSAGKVALRVETDLGRLRPTCEPAEDQDLTLKTISINENDDGDKGNGSIANPFKIETAEELAAMNDNLGAHYMLMNDIELDPTENWQSIGQKVWNTDQPFSGSFDGQGHTISGLSVESRQDNAGLFGHITSESEIKNIHLIVNKVIPEGTLWVENVGGLVGLNEGVITNVSVTGGEIRGKYHVGGLVGMGSNKGEISNAIVIGVEIQGDNRVGGLVGSNRNKISHASVTEGEIQGNNRVGGLVGYSEYSTGTISYSYTKSNVVTAATDRVGGLVGESSKTEISNSYSMSDRIKGSSDVGGLVGRATINTKISNSYASSIVLGSSKIGGLLGSEIGSPNPAESSYWNESVYGEAPLPDNKFGTAVNEEDMKKRATFDDWNFDDDWVLYDGESLPFLQWSNPLIELDAKLSEEMLEVGETTNISVNAKHEEGQYNATKYAQLEVTKGEDVIALGADGSVNALSPGDAEITARLYGKISTVDVTVNQFNIIRVAEVADHSVRNGTALDDIGLPERIEVTLNHDDISEDVSVEWQDADEYNPYDPFTAGTYSFTGILTGLPDGVGNSDDLTASANVTVGQPYIHDVGELDGIEVENGTAYTEIGLPKTVEITLNNGVKENVHVTWDDGQSADGKSEYDGQAAGNYKFTGTFEALPANIINPDNLKAQMTVTVDKAFITEIDPVDDIPVLNGTRQRNIEFPEQVQVSLNNGNKQSIPVTWESEDGTFNGKVAGTYAFHGLFELPDQVTNPDDVIATVNVVVGNLFIEEVTDLDPIEVKLGTDLSEIDFPSHVKVLLSNDEETVVGVNFNDSSPMYNGNVSGTYTFEKVLSDLPIDVFNPNNVTATIEVIVEPGLSPGIMEIVLDDSPKYVYPGAFVTIKGTNATIQLPADLPEGTQLSVESVDDVSFEGFVPAGELYNFVFTYPDGHEGYTGDFTLSLGVDKNADNLAIYYFNEQTKEWEHVGGDIKDGQITAPVSHFSMYGVFAKAQTEKPPTDPGDKDQDNGENEENGNGSNDNNDEISDNNGDKNGNKGEKDDQDKDGGGLLPKTATDYYNLLLIGFLLLVLATVTWQVNRKRQRTE